MFSKNCVSRAIASYFFAVCLLVFIGCNGGMIKATGRVMKDGQPFRPGKGERLQLSFYPVTGENGRPSDTFPASVNPADSTFEVRGKSGKGIPPGKYRVAVKIAYGPNDSDRLKGAFRYDKSPIVLEVSSSEEVVVDIGKQQS